MQSKLCIRRATADDIDEIAAIEQRCFPGPTAYPKVQLAYLVLKANSTCLVEDSPEGIHGFIIALYRRGTRVGCLETLDVDPRFQKMGVGQRLLAAAEADIEKRGCRFSQLEVSEGNKDALALYQKAGYTLKMRLPNYYRYLHCGTRDAVRMVKPLTPTSKP